MQHPHHPEHVSAEVLWVHVLGYWFVTCRVTMALWCYLPLTTAKAEDEQCLVKFTDRMEKWRSREGTCGQDPPQSPWPSGMTWPSSCSVPCPPEGTMLLLLLGLSSPPPSLSPSQVYFPGEPRLWGLQPPPRNLYLALKTSVLLTLTAIKGEARLLGPGEREEELKEVSLLTLQENLWPWGPRREGVLAPMMTELN